VEVVAIAGAMALKLQRSHPKDQKTKRPKRPIKIRKPKQQSNKSRLTGN
jgi:hypothetical protein